MSGTTAPSPTPQIVLNIASRTISANTVQGPVTVAVDVSVSANSFAFVVDGGNPATVAYDILSDDPSDTSELPSVQCSPDDFPNVQSCQIDGGWHFTAQGQSLQSAPKQILVTIPQSATAKRWTLRAGSEWAASPTTAAVQAVPATFPASDPGSYVGTVAWTNAGATSDAQSLSLPIRAVVTTSHVALIDPSRLLLPDGQAVFSRDASKVTMLGWLTSPVSGAGSLYSVGMTVSLTKIDPGTGQPVPSYDPTTGLITGSFAVQDEQGSGGFSGTVTLQRVSDTAACPATACSAGTYCDGLVHACLPGSAPASGDGIVDPAQATPSKSLASAAVSAWAPAVSSLVSANAAMLGGTGRTAMQRAYCFSAASQGQVAAFLDYTPGALMTPSQDLGCRLPSATQGAPLAAYPQLTFPFVNTTTDLGSPDAKGDALTMVANCLAELAAAPTGSLASDLAAQPKCVSLGRFFAALTPADDSDTGKKLSTQILRQWAGLNAYVANTTVQDQAYDNTLNAVVADDATRFATTIDQVQQDLLVFLDPRIRSRYLEGGTWPQVAAAPDYRLQRPVAHWAFNATTSPVPDADGGSIGFSVPTADLVGSQLQTLGAASCQSTAPVSLDDGTTHNRFAVAMVLSTTSTNGQVTLFEKAGSDSFKIQGNFTGSQLTVVASDSAGRSATFPMIDLCAGVSGCGTNGSVLPGFLYFSDDNGAYQLGAMTGQKSVVVAAASVVGGGPRWGASGTVALPCGATHSCTAFNTCTSYDLNTPGDGGDAANTVYSNSSELGWEHQVTCFNNTKGVPVCHSSVGTPTDCNSTAAAKRTQLAAAFSPHPPSSVLANFSVTGHFSSTTTPFDDGDTKGIVIVGDCDLSELNIPSPATRAKPVCGCQPNVPFLSSTTKIDEVSLWNRPLQPEDVVAMYNAYALNPAQSTVLPLPPPPARVAPAPQLVLPGTEQAGGLAPQLLESAAAHAHLLTAYVHAASGTIYAQCYQSDPLLPNPSQILQTVLSRVGPGLRLVQILKDQAAQLASAPGVTSALWYPRYQADLEALAGEMHGAYAALHQASTCNNPLGIEEGEIPLYIGDASGLAPVDRFFAGTRALIGLMNENDSLQGELTQAANAFQAAQAAYVSQQQSAYQITLAAADRTTTLNNLHVQYEASLRKYCGVPAGTDLLDAFMNHGMTVDNCFIASERTGCSNAAALLIRDVPSGCLRGDMGAHILALQTSNIDVSNALNALDRDIDQWRGDEQYCIDRAAFDNDTNALVQAHFATLEAMRARQAAADNGFSIIDGILDVGIIVAATAVSGPAGGAVAAGAVVAASAAGGGGGGNGDVAALGALKGINSDVAAIVDRSMAQDQATEDDHYQEMLIARAALKDSKDCFHKADNDMFSFGQAADTFRRAFQVAGAAGSAFLDDRDQVQGLVDEFRGQQGLINSIDRTPPHLHFWLDNAITNYQSHMRNARRLAFLAVRTFEYEAQVSSAQRQAVLSARTPHDLQVAMSQLALASSSFWQGPNNQGTPGVTPTVFSLRDDILDLPALVTAQSPPGRPAPLTASQAFTTLLTSDSGVLYDNSGNLLGHAIRFSLAGGQPWDSGTCAERIWRITPSVQMDNTSPPQGPNATRLVLYQQNTFGSQVCTTFSAPDLVPGATQVVRYQPTTSLLTGDAPVTFSSPQGFSSIPIDYVADMTVHDLKLAQQGDNPGGFVAGFAGRGVIGNYILLFPACNGCTQDSQGWTSNNLKHVDDVLLRFDIVSASNLDNDIPSLSAGATAQ
ncbi:MAG TPA: hypothetical protein VFP84_35165 [Kofleriaceae bacterium]|nr:hypothetical protein [Kofleriaceae bacterium]